MMSEEEFDREFWCSLFDPFSNQSPGVKAKVSARDDL